MCKNQGVKRNLESDQEAEGNFKLKKQHLDNDVKKNHGVKRSLDNDQEAGDNFKLKKQHLDNDLTQEELNDKLTKAIRTDDITSASEAIKKGSDINSVSSSGWSKLIEAATYKATQIIKLLIEAGADVNATRSDGANALYIVAHEGMTEEVKLLINSGANINVTNKHNCSPLYWAARYGYVEIVKLLVEGGANIDIQENISEEDIPGGDSPLKVAERNKYAGDGRREKYEEIIKYLDSHNARYLPNEWQRRK